MGFKEFPKLLKHMNGGIYGNTRKRSAGTPVPDAPGH